MAKRKGSLANVIWGLHWIARIVIAVLLDCVYGVCRFIDGILEKDIIKAVIGFFWIFYGLVVGWVIDIIFSFLKKRPPLF